MTPASSEKFVERIIERGHLSVIEHASATVKFVVDRGVSHELVRHRLCSFSQESTRYCDYSGSVTFVIPPWCTSLTEGEIETSNVLPIRSAFLHGGAADHWLLAMAKAELSYRELRNHQNWSPQQARSVLPNSLKTEIVVTANFREWLHIFQLRTAPAAHPQMREIMIPVCEEFQRRFPIVFDRKEE
jgi:thymidylate synthase (FAD)